MSRIGEAGEIVSAYVTHGAMRSDDEFDAHFQGLASLVPSAQRRTPSRAWRVVVVSGEEHQRLLRGEAIMLRSRAYGSWTKDRHAADLLLRGRCMKAADGAVSLIVCKDLTPGCVVVDVESLYRKLGWNHPDVDEWSRYVEWEQELILRQDARLCTIEPDDVVAAHAPGDPAAVRPYEGEGVWVEEVGDFVRIDEVLERSGDGAWRVVCADEAERTIVWNERHFAGWEAAEEPVLDDDAGLPVPTCIPQTPWGYG